MSSGFENAVAVYSVRGAQRAAAAPRRGASDRARHASHDHEKRPPTHSPPTIAMPSAAGVTCANGPEPTAIVSAPRLKADDDGQPGQRGRHASERR